MAGNLNAAVEAALAELPCYQWYTALPQLTSRITHPNPVVLAILKRVLIRVVGDFPQQVRNCPRFRALRGLGFRV